jgi:hypothetical protein
MASSRRASFNALSMRLRLPALFWHTAKSNYFIIPIVTLVNILLMGQ